MSDSDAAPPPPSSPGQSHRRPSWPRIGGYFTPEWLTTVFTIVLAGATVALVWTSIKQHGDSVEAIEATKRLAEATEKAAADRRQTASAGFVLKIEATLDEHRYDRISDDIQSHDSNYKLPKYTNKADADVIEYISTFEDLGYFVTTTVIDAKMAYEHFSFDIEKAWCNSTVQETIESERATDTSKTAQSDPQYGNFEKLAKEYLETDGESCKDLPSDATTTQKKKKKKSR
jgi:hypothetical protein